MKQHRFAFLDGLRGLAAVFVLARHTSFWHPLVFHAYLAVDLFFIMSGFVIAHAYDDRLRTGVLSVRDFMIVRLIRLYPVYLLSLILSAFIISPALNPSILFANLFFVPLTSRGHLFPLNGAYWTLFFELLVNAVYASLRPVFSDRLLKICIGLFSVSVISGVLWHGDLNAGFHPNARHVAVALARSFFGIAAGFALFRYKDLCAPILHRRISPWAVFPITSALLALPDMPAINGEVDLFAVFVVFPACVMIASAPTKTKALPILLALGSASYPVYLLHMPLGNLIASIWKDAGAHGMYPGVTFAALLILASLLLEKFYDLPVRRWLARRFSDSKKNTVRSGNPRPAE